MARQSAAKQRPTTVAQAIQQAIEAHRQGRLQEAEKLYSTALKAAPNEFDALRLLGVLRYQQGKLPEALRLIGAALKTNGRSTTAWSDQGLVLSALERHQEALESYDKALALAPGDANALINRGNTLHALRQFADAIACFDIMLANAPNNVDALCNRGNALLELKRHDEALESYDQALAAMPGHVNSLHGRATLLIERGDPTEALVSLRRLLVLQPDHIAGRNGLGQALLALDRAADALPHFERVLVSNPQHLGAIVGRGRALYGIGRTTEAVAVSEQALALAPEHPIVNIFRAFVFLRLERHDEALASADKAIALQPDHAEAFNSRGVALINLGRLEEALASYDQAIVFNPTNAEIYSNRAHVLRELRRFDEAVASCDQAIAINPDYAAAYNNRGNILNDLRRLDAALADYDKAIALDPKLAAAWLGRGNLMLYDNRPEEALTAFTKVLEIDPRSYKAMTQFAWFHRHFGDIDNAMVWYEKALEIRPDSADAISNRIFVIDFSTANGFAEQQAARRYWWDQIGVKIASQHPPHHENDRDPERRLVVGYVSSDFRHHSASTSFGPVLRNHDRSRFELVCYSCSTTEDDTTKEFEQIADRWRGAAQLSDDRLAEVIRADGIDILIDLSGHSAGNRLEVFARKPAPVQVTAWGHATGTGIPAIDYLFCDPVTVPHDVRHLFAEQMYDLPCSITLDAPPEGLHSPDLPMLAHGSVTFGVLNRYSKISDAAIGVWAQILHSVPASRLLLKDGALDDAALRGLLAGKFEQHGIAPDRLVFRGRTLRNEHLMAFREVDICLDPFPQNGGVSTWEAVQMGVPIVAVLGNGPANRISASILTSIGLRDWVADGLEAYHAIAVKFAGMPGAMKTLRQELPAKISSSAAGNTVTYTRAVEQGYRTMWERYCSGQRPA